MKNSETKLIPRLGSFLEPHTHRIYYRSQFKTYSYSTYYPTVIEWGQYASRSPRDNLWLGASLNQHVLAKYCNIAQVSRGCAHALPKEGTPISLEKGNRTFLLGFMVMEQLPHDSAISFERYRLALR